MRTHMIMGLLFVAYAIAGYTAIAAESTQLSVHSSAFQQGQIIPKTYTCQGADINPPLDITGIPSGTQSLTLIVDDPDAPLGTWQHWLVWNIPPNTTHIAEHSTPAPSVTGKNSAGNHAYQGPCPPFGTHRYYFRVYALDTVLSLKPNSKRHDVDRAIKGHVLAETTLMGRYKK